MRVGRAAAALALGGGVAAGVLAVTLSDGGSREGKGAANEDVATLGDPGAGRDRASGGNASSNPRSGDTGARDGPRPAARPRIAQRPIPFSGGRVSDTRRYALRHYGIRDHRLRDPRVIVQHFTVIDSFSAVFEAFARNAPDVELGELPGLCAHYVVDRDGRIYQLVSTRTMCRHTVGLNHTAIGIEHVGRSDAEVLGRARQLRASLALTRWLQARHRIRTRNVIGHSESLRSPYHRERVERLRRRTHDDFSAQTMARYRRLLARR
jgi:N-acetylmuramoyl-L-alanine amidase